MIESITSLPTIDFANPESCVVKLEAPFENDAGSIQNLHLGPLGGTAVIRSRQGAVRSNHYHKTDWHLLYVLRGRCRYYQRAVGDTKIPEPLYCYGGELIYTPPMVEHAFQFDSDTVLFSMSMLARSKEEHEADLVRVKFL